MSNDTENMNHVAFNAAGNSIATLQQIHAILDVYNSIESDEKTKARLLWAAESLAEFEIERQERAQVIALRAEGMLDQLPAGPKAA